MKSVKYNKHYMSRYKYPTRVVTDQLIIGYKSAQKDLEIKLKRPLHKDTKIKIRGGNWCFVEPKDGPVS
jgi:hypothetical protein